MLGDGHIWMIFLVLAVVLMIWGPNKLPEVGSGMGKAIREFRQATSGDAVAAPRATVEVDAPVVVGKD